MSAIEIPLLRESAAFAARLMAAAGRFTESRYQRHRRVNWSHRYSEHFYAGEANCFVQGPEAYLAQQTLQEADLPDVYEQRLRPKQAVTVVLKATAHWLFHLLGRIADKRLRDHGVLVYRKCYVDDIELVFDPGERGVVRAVYPFPINLRRQLRYLSFLRRERLDFKLAGNPYRPRDLLRFIVRRDVRSLMRLESRAQILHARQVVALGVLTVQLSDEFDCGSLDFARSLARFPVCVINSAHGVGKYLPVHAYQVFHVLTRKQQEYYHAARPCTYALRRLNDRTPTTLAKTVVPDDDAISLVFLSQTFAGLGDVIADNESITVSRLREELADFEGVGLFYKPHPNSQQSATPSGFVRLATVDQVNGRAGTLFVSFFSTCQIDPAFKGRKVLLRGNLIYPGIAFDDSETILDVGQLVELVKSRVAERMTRARSTVALEPDRCGA